MTNPHFDSVQAAQTRRLIAQSLSDEQIISALENMPPERAYKLAQKALTSAIRRSMQEAHQRPVVAE